MRDLWIDFNDVDDAGSATTLAKFASRGVSLAVGQELTVGDDEGNRCRARVVDIAADGVVTVVVDPGTFTVERAHARAIA